MATELEEGSPEEERQVRGLYASLQSLCEGVDDIVVCKAIGIFMVTVMHQSEQWKRIIPGFCGQIDQGAHLAMHYHTKEQEHGSEDEEGQGEEADESGGVEGEGTVDEAEAAGVHRDLEVDKE